MSQRVKPVPVGVSFIITSVDNLKDTWSRAFKCNINAEVCYRQLIQASPGLIGRIIINKYEDGKHVEGYVV